MFDIKVYTAYYSRHTHFKDTEIFMFKPKKVSGLTQTFSSAMMSAGLFFSAQPSRAQEAPPPPPEPVPTAQPNWNDDGSLPKHAEVGGLNDRIDNYFAHKPVIYVSKDNFWIAPAARYDVTLLPLEKTGVLDVTREYVEMKPLKKEWYGRASGVEYGVQFNIGAASKSGNEWTYRGGFNLGYYDSPIERVNGRFVRDNEGNARAGAFVEGVKNVHVGSLPASLVIGSSVGRVSGPEIGRGSDARVYSEVNFPNLFNSSSTGEYSLGKFSGVVRGYAGTQNSGVEAGIYYNDLKDDGKGINMSLGPEIRHDKERGTTFRFRFKFSPKKFW